MNGPQDASPTSASRTVTVDGDEARYLQKISVGPHLLQADELSDVGGTDAGPNAYELLLAASNVRRSETVATSDSARLTVT
jgi:hypothetical protein